MASKTFNFGIIGYGLSAKIFHIPHLTSIPSFRLHGIVQRSPQPGNDAGADFPQAKAWCSADELFADSAVDVVVVTTPPDSHFALTRRALESGKHVVVEKPFVPTHAEAQELVALAAEKKRSIAVYQSTCDPFPFSAFFSSYSQPPIFPLMIPLRITNHWGTSALNATLRHSRRSSSPLPDVALPHQSRRGCLARLDAR